MSNFAPLINGRRYSYSSIEILLKVGLRPVELFVDVDDISYSEALTFEFKRGTSRVPIGSTAGTYEPAEGSLQMGKSTFTEMVMKAGPGWLGLNVLMNVAYADIGELVTVDTIVARFTGVEEAHAAGPAALVSVVKFMPLQPILRNGIPPMLNRVV